MSTKYKKNIRVVSEEQQEQHTLQGTAEHKRLFDELLEQKRYIDQLKEELNRLREEIKEKKEEIEAAEARLCGLIEEGGQLYLPFNNPTPPEATYESVDA